MSFELIKYSIPDTIVNINATAINDLPITSIAIQVWAKNINNNASIVVAVLYLPS